MTSFIVRTLSDRLVDVVRNRILNGDAPADQPIRQESLAAELGVSKIPLREALARLEEEGLVRSHANRGYFVRALDSAEAEEVYSLRLKLEPDATAMGAQRASEPERQAAIAAFNALGTCGYDDKAAVIAVNRTFHLALIRPSAQPITMQLLERLHVLGDRYVGKHLEQLGRSERATNEHAELLDRWLARDIDAVVAVSRRHIEHTLADLREQLVAEALQLVREGPESVA